MSEPAYVIRSGPHWIARRPWGCEFVWGPEYATRLTAAEAVDLMAVIDVAASCGVVPADVEAEA